MKKILSLLLSLTMVFSLCACGGENTTEPELAKEPTVSDIIKGATLQYPSKNDLFKYNIYDTYVEITEYIGADDSEEVIVPAILEELPVYVVDFNVFDKSNVKSIVFEEGIYKINSGFSPSLVSVVLPSTIDFVGYGMFENCYALENVVMPEGIDSIQGKTFKSCRNLKEVTIPSTVKSLWGETFAYCVALEKVNLPDGLEKIGKEEFLGCESLKTITIPNTVEEIDFNAFFSSGLEYIEIPENVKKLGSGAFTACENLKTVKVYNAEMNIIPETGTVALLFNQCSDDLVVHGKPASTIANACGKENVLFEVIK